MADNTKKKKPETKAAEPELTAVQKLEAKLAKAREQEEAAAAKKATRIQTKHAKAIGELNLAMKDFERAQVRLDKAQASVDEVAAEATAAGVVLEPTVSGE